MTAPPDPQLPERVEAQPLARAPDPMSILQLGVEKGIDAESIERLSALAEKWMDRQARQDFNAAMAEFHRRIPPIKKTAQAEYTTSSGST